VYIYGCSFDYVNDDKDIGSSFWALKTYVCR